MWQGISLQGEMQQLITYEKMLNCYLLGWQTNKTNKEKKRPMHVKSTADQSGDKQAFPVYGL